MAGERIALRLTCRQSHVTRRHNRLWRRMSCEEETVSNAVSFNGKKDTRNRRKGDTRVLSSRDDRFPDKTSNEPNFSDDSFADHSSPESWSGNRISLEWWDGMPGTGWTMGGTGGWSAGAT